MYSSVHYKVFSTDTPTIFPSSASQLAVTIDVSYTKPSDFSMDPPNYRAGSSITLTCRVEGVTDGLTYSWSSTCAHNCFVRGMTTQNVTRHGLRSTDSGSHTCSVTDTLARRGTAIIVMNVTGKAGYVFGSQRIKTAMFITCSRLTFRLDFEPLLIIHMIDL